MQSPLASALRKCIAKIRRSEDGQDLLEYGMLAALIALVALGAVTSVGQVIYSAFWQTIGNLSF